MSKAINGVSGDIYIGKGAGTMIISDMLTAKKSIRVMSPYLSASLVDILLSRHNLGVYIELITADDIEDHKNTSDKNSYKIIRQHKHLNEKLKNRKDILKWTGIGLMGLMGILLLLQIPGLFTSSFYLADFVQVFVLASFILIGHFIWKQARNMKDHLYSYSSLFPIKIFYSYFTRKNPDKSRVFTLHSKLYIIDDRIAYLGSVNFTTSGHVFNHETRIRITDPQAIEKLKEEFEELLMDNHYSARTVDDWGKELYERKNMSRKEPKYQMG